jgi:hypothetical protein
MAPSAVGLEVAYRVLRLMLGVVLVWLTVEGLRTGTGQMIYRLVSRRDHPPLYWTAIGLTALCASILLLGALDPEFDRL